MVDLQISDLHERRHKPTNLRFNKREIQASFQRNIPLKMVVSTTKKPPTKNLPHQKENHQGDRNTI